MRVRASHIISNHIRLTELSQMESAAEFLGHPNKEDTLSQLWSPLLLTVLGPSRQQVGRRILVAVITKKTPESGCAESSSLENLKTCSILGTWVPFKAQIQPRPFKDLTLGKVNFLTYGQIS